MGAIHMDVKDTEKDADPLAGSFRSRYGGCFGHQAVARRYDQAFTHWNGALRITEEPQEKRREQDRRQAPNPISCNPFERCGNRQQTDSVDVTVANHGSQRLYGD
jgi:hypothetical protein